MNVREIGNSFKGEKNLSDLKTASKWKHVFPLHPSTQRFTLHYTLIVIVSVVFHKHRELIFIFTIQCYVQFVVAAEFRKYLQIIY